MSYQREVRLGLVLYGGVSLAVYENGVAQELYRAIAGQGLYGLLSKLIDSDIVVDIISGTSAGGVNGVMLAYALANKKDFRPSADLWRNDGDIYSLMRTANDSNASSILNSTYYQDRLEDCFLNGLKYDPAIAPHIDELDLFVTSTDANGAISTVFDDLGHPIDIKNHRALFKLAYRGSRKNNFTASPGDLAKLSRMTSCFPVAFEPVSITDAEQNFFKWGKLHFPAVFLDGGILNNKPFTSTIDAIASRTAIREVERFLIYVEPAPEQFKEPTQPVPSPTVEQAAFASLISIPGYQSIAADLQRIEANNERAARISEILDALPKAPARTLECLDQSGVVSAADTPCDPTIYYSARLLQLRDAAVKAILDSETMGREYFPAKIDATPSPFRPEEHNASNDKDSRPDNRRSARILVQSFNAWSGDGLITLSHYDVFFRMRRVTYLSNCLMRAEKVGAWVPTDVWEAVNHSFKLLEMVKWAIISWLTKFDFEWQALSSRYPDLDFLPEEQQRIELTSIAQKIWSQVATKLSALLQTGITVPVEPTPNKRQSFYEDLQKVLTDNPSAGVVEVNLLDSIDAVLKQAIVSLTLSDNPANRDMASLLRDEFCRFLEVDQQLFLIQIGSDFESTDMIRVVRFSPLDAQRGLSVGTPESKVRGTALGAFGGFFKKSWRANDIMMGRLDTACLLTECLLTKERLSALVPRRMATPLTLTPDEISSYFPRLGANAVNLATTINTYLAAPNKATEADWNIMINQIVAAAHDEIQSEEWKTVVKCAIEQEYAWSQYHQSTVAPSQAYNPKNLIWNRAKAKPDEVLVDVAAYAISMGMIPPFTPGSQPSTKFVDEIPNAVLTELIAQGSIRLGKSLLASISNEGLRQKIEGNPLYSLPFKWMAPISYRLARIRRTQPDTAIILNTAIPVFGLTILALDLAMYFLGVQMSGRTWVLLVASPLAVLAVWGWLFRR